MSTCPDTRDSRYPSFDQTESYDMPGIDLSLPPLEARLTHRPEVAPAKVKAWLAQQPLEPSGEAARIVGDALAVLNRA